MNKLIKKAGDKSINTSIRFNERNQRWIAQFVETTEEYFLNEEDARKWLDEIYNQNTLNDASPEAAEKSISHQQQQMPQDVAPSNLPMPVAAVKKLQKK